MSSNSSIDAKLEYGLRWTMISQTITTWVRAIGAVAYTRFLLPKDLGAFGLALIIYSGLFLLVQAPIRDAVVYYQEKEEAHASAAFWLLMGCSLVGIVFVLILAGPISRFYETPLAAGLIRLMMVRFFFQSLAVVPAALLIKHFKFRLHETLHLLTTILTFSGWIALAFAGFGAWSLVIGPLISSIFWACMMWLAANFRPILRPPREAFNNIIKFSRTLFGSKLSIYLKLNLDNAAVGTLGARALGHYNFGENQSDFAIVALGEPIAQIALPAMAAVQQNISQVRQIYLNMLRLTATFTTPMQIGVFVITELMIGLFFGEQWLAAVPIYRAYLIFRLVDALLSLCNAATSALGRPDIRFMIEMGQLPFFIAATWFGLSVWGGIIGVAYSLTFVRLVAGLIYFAATMRLIRISLNDIWRYLLPSSLAGLLMGIMVYGINALDLFAWLQLSIPSPFLADGLLLLMLMMTGIISYFTILFSLNPSGFKAVVNIVWEVILPEYVRAVVIAMIGPLSPPLQRLLHRWQQIQTDEESKDWQK